jgi:hypothetical protein
VERSVGKNGKRALYKDVDLDAVPYNDVLLFPRSRRGVVIEMRKLKNGVGVGRGKDRKMIHMHLLVHIFYIFEIKSY